MSIIFYNKDFTPFQQEQQFKLRAANKQNLLAMQEKHRKKLRRMIDKHAKILRSKKPSTKKQELKTFFKRERDCVARLNRIAIWQLRRKNRNIELQQKVTHAEELIKLRHLKEFNQKWRHLRKDFPEFELRDPFEEHQDLNYLYNCTIYFWYVFFCSRNIIPNNYLFKCFWFFKQ